MKEKKKSKRKINGTGRRPKRVPSVAARLIELEGKITERWEERVRSEISGADEHSSRVIKNSLPNFIVNLAGILSREGAARATAKIVCQEHGQQRAERTFYSAEQVVQEYGILREVIFDLLEASGSLDVRSRGLINASIDGGIAESVSGFLERLGAEKYRVESQLIESRERYTLALQAGKIGVWEMDLRSGLLQCNERQTYIFDLRPGEDSVTFPSLLARIHADDREEVSRELDLAVSARRDLRVEFRVLRTDGVQHWVRVNGRPYYDADQRPFRILGTTLDITEAAMEQQQRHELIDSLTREREIRERFMDALTHDLRTPLAAAKMSGQILARKAESPDDVVRLAARVIDSIDRADEMISDLLDSSRIRAGLSMAVRVHAAELRRVLVTALEGLTLIHGNRFVLEGTGEVEGFWDTDGLRRIVENLANNAVKHGSPHSPIEVRYAVEGAEVLISVANTGATLPADELRVLFGLFTQTDQARALGRKGWGIGLTVVKGIAEAHGGRVTVTSEGGLTTFAVRLPRDARAAEE